MAVIQILLVIVAIVRRYDFSLVASGEVGIRPMFILRPDGPIAMNFRPLPGGEP